MDKIKISFSKELLGVENVEVITRNGERVRIVCTDANIVDGEDNGCDPIVGIILSNGEPTTFREDGRYYSEMDHDLDLFMEIDVDAMKRRLGFDPVVAAVFASALFGNPGQYDEEELELISMLSALFAADFMD